jgi:hypothetical protein
MASFDDLFAVVEYRYKRKSDVCRQRQLWDNVKRD